MLNEQPSSTVSPSKSLPQIALLGLSSSSKPLSLDGGDMGVKSDVFREFEELE